ncbi:hypothetical protein, partial [Salmonella sp. s51228]|uniref:hypothetical protein n=1 Tax=Salmonella sp. s51228 TaxID=3159652 RepID=UPI00397FB7F3
VYCPKYKALRKEYEKSDEYIMVSKKYNYVFKAISDETGDEVNLTNIWIYWDCTVVDENHNLTVPDWAKKYANELKYLSSYNQGLSASTMELKFFFSGRMLWEF